MRALGRPDRGEVAPGELGGRVDGVAPAGAEEDPRVVERRQVGEALGEIERRAVGEHAERLVAGQHAHLRHRGLDDLVAPVADVHAPQARRPVEVPLAVLVPHEAPSPRAMTNSLPRTACMSAKACQRRVSAGMTSTLAPRLRHRQSPGRRNLGRGVRRHVATTWRCSTSSPRAMRTSLTIVAGNRPCSTTPGIAVEPVGQRARIVEGAEVVGDHAAVGRRRRARAAPAPRPAAAAWPARRSSAARVAPAAPSASTTLSDEAMTTKRAEAAATTFSRVCAPPPPLMTQPSGATWSAPSMAMSSASSVSNGSTTSPSSLGPVLGGRRRRHAAQRQAARASAGSR